MKSRNASIKLLVIAVLVILSCAYILPIYVMVVNSLKTLPEIMSRTYLAFPRVPNCTTTPQRSLGARIF